MNYDDLKNTVKTALQGFNEAYVKAHGRGDNGTCGSAVALISFGRKSKLRKELIEAGLVEDFTWSFFGKKFYTIKIPRLDSDLGTQNVAYDEGRAGTVVGIFKEAFPEFEVMRHSWMD